MDVARLSSRARRPRPGLPRRLRRIAGALPLTAVTLIASVAVPVGIAVATQSAASASPATTVDLAPVADTFSTPRAPRKAKGSADYLTAGGQHAGRQVIYLRFQVPAADRSAVTSAQLQLTRTNHHLAGTLVARTVGAASWNGGRLTAATAPAVGKTLDSVSTNRRTNSITFDVTAAVRDQAVVNLAVELTAPTGFAQFRSREASGAGPRLQLTLSGDPQSAPPTATAPPDGATDGTDSSTDQPACTVSAELVPSCGAWWGAAPMAYMNEPLQQSVPQEEQLAGRPLDIVHTYHTNGQLFPTAAERAQALEPGKNRLLLINWKPATDMSWAAVAAGRADARIDALARYIDATFPYKFFLSVWHEPENDVVATAGSGMTAADYAAMYRHVVLRLRHDGVTNAVTVMNYMGFVNWAAKDWFGQLWPGGDVVDWIGLDPYGSGAASGYSARDFATLVNRPLGSFPGYYTWATTQHPGKPIMLAEWGVTRDPSNPGGQASFFATVQKQLDSYPAVRALVYFDMPKPPTAGWETSPAATPSALSAYRQLATSAAVRGPRFSYPG